MKSSLLNTLLLLSVFIFLSCKEEEKSTNKFTNDLVHESSPYLLQHAHNPVNWKAWNNETLELAKKEDKPIIISVGYSSCHWCHVMAHESFEDEEVAKIMNENFINIKIDREERPDVDQIYMNAVQLMNNGNGGWPLNAITLPDGRPFFGGTYFTKEQWIETLHKTIDLFKNERKKIEEFATRLQGGIEQISLIEAVEEAKPVNDSTLLLMHENWKKYWDLKNGGIIGNEKFMMPNNYSFLLRYGVQNNDEETLNFVRQTLDVIALKGVYDHIGGGFYRYATDNEWKVPHFEKMLYDNAQLVSLYSDAYSYFGEERYKEIVIETLQFIDREMTSEDGLFYAAIDADSEKEEGKFYVWSEEELKNILVDDFDLFADYFNVNEQGLWEENKYVFIRDSFDADFAEQNDITLDELKTKVASWKEKLLDVRNKRIKPGLDTKALASWNGLMAKAYVDAYKVLGNEEYLNKATKALDFISANFMNSSGKLYHSYISGEASIDGFLDDYAHIAEAYLALYEVTFNEDYLNASRKLTDKAIEEFFDEKTGLFYYSKAENLITKLIKTEDGVIPSSNSVMANNLFKLSHYFGEKSYAEMVDRMLAVIRPNMEQYGGSSSNWGQLVLNELKPYYEIVVVGDKAPEKALEMYKKYIPNAVFAGSTKESNMPLLENRFQEDETYIYVCQNRVCKLPVTDVEVAVSQLK